ncbi:MAG: tetratricopeptide repeat protein [Acidobacteriota bacterium]|nr:tetratricopeptide repeat protein [Acidobacteriota bacterium]
MRKFRPIPLFASAPLLAVTLIFTATVRLASGQTPNSSPEVKPQPASSPMQNSSPEATGTRSRRAPSEPREQKPLENQESSSSDEAALVSEKGAGPKSEIATLRDEISAATNEQARARLQLKLVDHLVSAGLKQEAIAELKAMSDEERFDPQGFYNIANAQVRLGASEGAVKSYRKAIEQRKGRYSRASNNLGVVLLREGNWDEAYEAFMSALRQESFRYAEASFNLGRLYAARGENDLAVREWHRAVAVDPEHDAAVKALSNTRNASNIAVTPRAPRSMPNTTARRPAVPAEKARSTSSFEPGKPARAGLSKPRNVPAYKVDPETYALLQRGRTARDRGRNEDAIEKYRQVLARMSGYFPPANLELSYVLITLKRIDEAIATLLPITLRNGTEIPISNYHLARLYEARGELKLAEDLYSRAAEAYGGSNIQFILDISRVREKQGNLTGALVSLEQYINGMERQGQKPEWSDERLTTLRQKLAASQPKP